MQCIRFISNPKIKKISRVVLYLLLFVVLNCLASIVAQAQRLSFIDGIEIAQDSRSIYGEAANTSASFTSSQNTATEALLLLQFKYAQLLNLEVESIANLNLYRFIDNWLNTRYRLGGSNKSGIDCSGFSRQLSESVFNVCLPRTAREQYAVTSRVSHDALKEGDLVFFNTRGGVSHVGVYLANDYFIHSSTGAGVIISRLDEPYYSKRYIGAGRIDNSNEVLR